MHLLTYAESVALALGLFGTLTSTVFLGMLVVGITSYRRSAHQQRAELSHRFLTGTDFLPAVTLMKPLHGLEPGLEDNLRSFYNQSYFALAPDAAQRVEFLFCARTDSDPGLQTARRIAAEFPEISSRFVSSGEPWAPNAKVCSLSIMARAASHDLWVISDSDVRVPHDYLLRVISPFANTKVGCVTTLYRGVVIEGGFWSRLEATGMTVEMSSGVCVANLLEPMQFALGPTMAARRNCVDEIGGFDSMADFCADDFILGNRIAAAGHIVALATCPIDHMVLNASFIESVKHQVRWTKSTRFSRPKGHFGSSLTFGTPFGILACVGGLITGHIVVGTAVLAWTVLARIIQGFCVARLVVEKPRAWPTALLFPLRDLMGFFFWVLSYSSPRILWRGEVYELYEGGRMRPVRS